MSDLRRNQLVVPFGVGAIYDYLNFTAMTMTVDHWGIDSELKKNLAIHDNRLIDYINKKLIDFEGENHQKVRFICAPPIGRQRNPTDYQKANEGSYKAVKFPAWGVCSRCSSLSKFDPFSQKDNICNNTNVPDRLRGQPSCGSLRKRGGKIEPVRFVAFCSKGHIQDLPYIEIMSTKCSEACNLEMGGTHSSARPSLYLFDDGRGHGFNSLRLHCNICKSTTSLRDISSQENIEKKLDKFGTKLFKCHGCKPWTGEDNEECDEILDITPRPSSRIYMPIQQTAIFIPEYEEEMHEIFYDDLYANWIEEDTPIIEIENALKILPESTKKGLSNEDIVNLIQNERDRQRGLISKLDNDSSDIDTSFLKKEFDTLTQEKVNEDKFVSKKEDMDKYSEKINQTIKGLHSVSKLVSTTALLGFQRKAGGNAASDFNACRTNADFLPAFEVIGEGIFINFGFEKISSWKQDNPNLKNRIKQLKKNSELDYIDHKDRFFDAGYVLIHTFSHMLMRQLEIECGYSLSELKERIYFDNDEKMAGLLIYTASADSQGSLGGLVRTIKPNFFETLFANAIENSYVCFNDPICIESKGQGHSGLCLAACHACSMVPDLACETLPKNIFLDRNMLIGNDENALGYFISL